MTKAGSLNAAVAECAWRLYSQTKDGFDDLDLATEAGRVDYAIHRAAILLLARSGVAVGGGIGHA